LRIKARPASESINKALSEARHLHDVCLEKSELRYQQTVQEIDENYAKTGQEVEQELKRSVGRAGELRVSCRMRTDERMVQTTAKHEQLHKQAMAKTGARSPGKY
jgi:flagellar motility protein MotE (MotC chaperone)